MSDVLVSVDIATEAVGAVSVADKKYNVMSPTVGDMRVILGIESERASAEENSDTSKQIDYLLQMLGILIPDLPTETAEKLSIASMGKIMEAANKAIGPKEDKKK